MATVWVVEVESGCTDYGNAMLFDSVWTSLEGAKDYAKARFNQQSWARRAPNYDITAVNLEGS